MKILMVAIPNHHFFRWVNQLQDSGFEVYWFDVSSNGTNSPQIPWVTQHVDWKLKWDYPLRSKLKKHLPKLYNKIQKINEVHVEHAFNKFLNASKPDIIHCFEMKLSGIPILETLLNHNNIPLIYSSWGSDLFYFEKLGVTKNQVNQFLNRADYLITDCIRDFGLAQQNGFSNTFLDVLPGNGGLEIQSTYIQPTKNRDTILIKGYDDGVGKAIEILKAIEHISIELIKPFKIVVYSADDVVINYIKSSQFFNTIEVEIFSRYTFVKNEKLLELMGQSVIHIANSISDGMPNALLEAMAMGAFPIQSNPGNVTEEVVTHNKNGFLIENPLDVEHITALIKQALLNELLRLSAQDYNVNFMAKNYKRSTLQPKIVILYNTVLK
jgi:glycosyltransferase involved in cell wall biosynthesis